MSLYVRNVYKYSRLRNVANIRSRSYEDICLVICFILQTMPGCYMKGISGSGSMQFPSDIIVRCFLLKKVYYFPKASVIGKISSLFTKNDNKKIINFDFLQELMLMFNPRLVSAKDRYNSFYRLSG